MRGRETLRVLTWNLRRSSGKGLGLLLKEIERRGGWDVLCLQELAIPNAMEWVATAARQGVQGHLLLVNDEQQHDTAILVASHLRDRVRQKQCAKHHMWVRIEDTEWCAWIGSGHLPTSWEPLEVFERHAETLHCEMREKYHQPGTSFLIMGVDANARTSKEWLPANCCGDKVDLSETSSLDRKTKERCEAWSAMCASSSCRIANSFDNSRDEWWTLQKGSRTKQVDYLLTLGLPDSKASPLYGCDCNSDHIAIRMEVARRIGDKLRFRKRRQSKKGWRPRGPEEVNAVRAVIDRNSKTLFTCGQWQAVLQEAMEAVGALRLEKEEIGKKTETWRQYTYWQKELDDIDLLLDECEDPATERELAKEKRRLRRRKKRWRRRQRLGDLEGRAAVEFKRTPPSLLSAAGNEVYDRTEWPIIISDFASNKHSDPFETREDQIERLRQLEAQARYRWMLRTFDYEPQVTVSAEDVAEAMEQLKCDKQTAGDDLPAELLGLLDHRQKQWLANAMERRLRGASGACAPISDWLAQILHGVPKSGDSRKPERWRYISVAPALFKCYEIILWNKLEVELAPLPHTIMAFRRHRQTMDISEWLRTLAAKSAEWNKPLLFASMDIKQAFDYMRPGTCYDTLINRGASPELALAWLREHVDMVGYINLAGIPGASPVPLGRGCRQGGARTPVCWNHLMAAMLDYASSLPDWPVGSSVAWLDEEDHQLEAWGESLWADNFFLVSSCPQKIRSRAECLREAAEHFGLEFGDDSLELVANERAKQRWREEEGEGAQIQLADGRAFKQVAILRCLGVAIDCKGSTACAVDHRLSESTKLWHRLRSLLADRRLSLRERLEKYGSTVAASALHGCGGWVPTRKLGHKLQQFEQRHLREIVAGRRPRTEEWSTWVQRAAWSIRRARTRWRRRSLVGNYLRRHWTWLGHNWRNPQNPPSKLVLAWRPLRSWRTCQGMARDSNRMRVEEGAHELRSWQKSIETEVQEYVAEEYEDQNASWTTAAEQRRWWSGSQHDFADTILKKWRLV